jgi:cyanate permease
MKPLLTALPLLALATASSAHNAPQLHHHVTDANWLPLLLGLLAIATAALVAWMRK